MWKTCVDFSIHEDPILQSEENELQKLNEKCMKIEK